MAMLYNREYCVTSYTYVAVICDCWMFRVDALGIGVERPAHSLTAAHPQNPISCSNLAHVYLY